MADLEVPVAVWRRLLEAAAAEAGLQVRIYLIPADAHGIAHTGCTLHLSGCSARIMLLPIRVRQVLSQFNTYPTLDAALTALGCA